MILSLDKRWCDLYADATNTQTVRERIHDMYAYIYDGHTDIPDSDLDKMPQEQLEELVDELDWLASK